MNVLTIQNLHKTFGKQKVIDNLSMSVPEGSIFGFIGKNGAGKTTTMKMVLGLLRPDSGNIHVCNEPVCFGQTQTNHSIGYLPDVPEFYNYMTPVQYLKLCGEVIGLSKAEISGRSQELLSLVGLNGASKQLGGFSRGIQSLPLNLKKYRFDFRRSSFGGIYDTRFCFSYSICSRIADRDPAFQ